MRSQRGSCRVFWTQGERVTLRHAKGAGRGLGWGRGRGLAKVNDKAAGKVRHRRWRDAPLSPSVQGTGDLGIKTKTLAHTLCQRSIDVPCPLVHWSIGPLRHLIPSNSCRGPNLKIPSQKIERHSLLFSCCQGKDPYAKCSRLDCTNIRSSMDRRFY